MKRVVLWGLLLVLGAVSLTSAGCSCKQDEPFPSLGGEECTHISVRTHQLDCDDDE